MRVEHHETPDIEIAADQYEEEQAVLRELAGEAQTFHTDSL